MAGGDFFLRGGFTSTINMRKFSFGSASWRGQWKLRLRILTYPLTRSGLREYCFLSP